MSTLDMPQTVEVCSACKRRIVDQVALREPVSADEMMEICWCSGFRPPSTREPTLLYADFTAYMDALRLKHEGDVPDDDVVWDLLESRADAAPSNREAIDNAIRAVVSER